MHRGLKDKVALVVASSSGLGRAVAEELAAEGASLVINSRNTEGITKTASEIADSQGAHVMAVAADVSDKSDVQRLVEAALARFGHIDILVTNGGGPPAGKFD